MNAEAMAVLTTTAGASIPLVGVNATGRLDGLLFELEVEQRYQNRSTTNIEAVYTFPVPLRAAFLGLEIEIGARRLIARAKRTDQARREYEEALDEGNTAVLLEQADEGLYTVSLGNLLAGEAAVIRYRYAELLDVAQGSARLAIPTVIAPRYGDASRRVQPHQVPGVNLAVDYPFGLRIIVEGVLAGVPLTSPTHAIHTTREGLAVVVTLAEGAWLDRDFVLRAELGDFRGAAVTARDGDEYVALVSWTPAVPAPIEAPLALKVLIDCSGSMGGDSIAQARRALTAILDRLAPEAKRVAERSSAPSLGCCGGMPPDSLPRRPGAAIRGGAAATGDYIGLTRFGSNVVPVTDGLQRVTPALLSQLRDVARNLAADLGGTELPGALRAVVSQPTQGAAHPAVLLVTDGEIWAIDQALAAVASAGHRLFVVAVGAAPNEALARRVAEVTGGACEFVTPGEDMEQAILRMARRVCEPAYRLGDVRWPIAPRWIAPQPAAVFSGDTVHLQAGFREQPWGVLIATVTNADGETATMQSLAVSSIVRNGDTLARLAAARRLGALDDEEAAALAERYQLASRWTAFVVVDEREAKATQLPTLATAPQMLAAGWGGAGTVVAQAPAADKACYYDALDYRVAPQALEWDRAYYRESRARATPRARRGNVPSGKTAAHPRGFDAESSSMEFDEDSPSAIRTPRLRESADTEAHARPIHATPIDVATRLLEGLAGGHRVPRCGAGLAAFGVPADLITELLAVADDHGVAQAQAVHLFAALLVDRLKADLATGMRLDTDEVRRFMAILGDRRMRALRSQLARLLSVCTADAWGEEP